MNILSVKVMSLFYFEKQTIFVINEKPGKRDDKLHRTYKVTLEESTIIKKEKIYRWTYRLRMLFGIRLRL